MFTATGFIVMCVAAISTCTAKAVESPPSPCGPMPRLFTACDSSASSFAPSGSSQRMPSGRVAATFARCMQRSEVPPTPTPTMVGGQTLPPAWITQSTTKRFTAATPSAGIGHLQEGAVLRARALRDHLDAAAARRRSEVDVDDRHAAAGRVLVLPRDRMHDGAAQRMLARRALGAAPIASFSAQPSTWTLRPIGTLKIGMPVSWHSRLSVRSATPMFSIIVPRTRCAVASVSRASRPSKPRLMSSGRIFSARMYSSRATSSTQVRDRCAWPFRHGG